MGRVLLTPKAEESLLEIGRYVAKQNQSLQRAHDVLDSIDEKCELYASHPRAGTACEDLGPGVRYFLVHRVVVIYRPLNDGILVLYAAHGHQDWPALFRRVYWNE